MFRWVAEAGSQLPSNHRVLTYIAGVALPPVAPRGSICRTSCSSAARDAQRPGAILRGRCAAYGTPDNHGVRRLTFLGQDGVTSEGAGSAYVAHHTRALREAGIDIDVLTDRDTSQALALLRKSGAIAVMPSLRDNQPHTVLECLGYGIPFIAANVGGVGELVHADRLFAPRARDLADTLAQRASRVATVRDNYESAQAIDAWASFTQTLVPKTPRPKANAAEHAQPRVSICIPHYNHGKYLPQMLQSVAAIAYDNLEVIVVDDDSNDAHSLFVLHEQEALYAPRGWRFLVKKNGGPGAARNVAAAHAAGRYLIFMDADNLATPKMVRQFVQAMEHTQLDCLSCHMVGFSGDQAFDDRTATPLFRYAPLGPCLESGLLENVFGDTNFIIKQEIFAQVGGFNESRSGALEDWTFLARLVLQGFGLDTIPEPLFFYRAVEDSFGRTTSQVAGFRRLSAEFCQRPERIDMAGVINHLLAPLYSLLRLGGRSGGAAPSVGTTR